MLQLEQLRVLGPDLWNISYDEVLRLQMPDQVFTVCYADDLVIVNTAREVEAAERKLNIAMQSIINWTNEHRLEIAEAKTEIVMFILKHIETMIPIAVPGSIIETKTHLKYLGIQLDTKLIYMKHIEASTEKARRLNLALSRLMRNMHGPRASKRRLLMSVTHSIMLYGAEVWADSLRKTHTRRGWQEYKG